MGAIAALAATAGPAQAHSEGLTPYRYVAAPAGVRSEGPPEVGVSVQPLGRPGFAGTTDNQMQLTLPSGALPRRGGETGVRVTLEQLDPARLPALPAGLEPEGNGYRVSMVYAASKRRLPRLSRPAALGLSAPAAPTALYELVDGAWRTTRSTSVAAEEGFSSVVELARPGTFLQVYDPATTPAATGADPLAASDRGSGSMPGLIAFGAPVLMAMILLGVLGRRRTWPRPGRRAPRRTAPD